MAISPTMLKENFTQEVDELEQYFDKKLSTVKLSTLQAYTCIDTPKDRSFHKDHFIILANRYISAGWKNVEYVSDQRDGEYLKFTV